MTICKELLTFLVPLMGALFAIIGFCVGRNVETAMGLLGAIHVGMAGLGMLYAYFLFDMPSWAYGQCP